MRIKMTIFMIFVVFYAVVHLIFMYRSGFLWKQRVESRLENLIVGESTYRDIENVLENMGLHASLEPSSTLSGVDGVYSVSLRGIVTPNPLSLVSKYNLHIRLYVSDCIYVDRRVDYFFK